MTNRPFLAPVPARIAVLVGQTMERHIVEEELRFACWDLTLDNEGDEWVNYADPTPEQVAGLYAQASLLGHGWTKFVSPEAQMGGAQSGVLPLEGAWATPGYEVWWKQVEAAMKAEEDSRTYEDSFGAGVRPPRKTQVMWTGSMRNCWSVLPNGSALFVVVRKVKTNNPFEDLVAVVAARTDNCGRAIVSHALAREQAAPLRPEGFGQREVSEDEIHCSGHTKKTALFVDIEPGKATLTMRTKRHHDQVAWSRHLDGDLQPILRALRGDWPRA